MADRLRGPQADLDKEDLLRLTVERTGYTYEALAGMAEEQAARRRQEDRAQALAAALRNAQAARAEGLDAREVAQTLTAALAPLQAQIVDPPKPFSVDRLERESQELPTGKLSGWEALDDLEVRFIPGELAVLAGRTGHAKTCAVVGLTLNWLRMAEREESDELFVFYSAEEPEVRIYHRLLALLTIKNGDGWTASQVRDYLRGPESRSPGYRWPNPKLLEEARERLRPWEHRLFIVHRPLWTVQDLGAHARELAERHRVGGVLVDYLQRIPPPPGPYDRRDIEVSAVARHLKALAADLTAPVVVGAQINREAVPEGYSRKLAKKTDYNEAEEVIRAARPDLHHLREGGSEQEGDLILGLLSYAADYRTESDGEGQENYRDVPEVTRLDVGILKNRYGAPGRWAKLAFEGRFGLIWAKRGDEVL